MRFLLRNKIPFFPHVTVSWSLPVARIIFMRRMHVTLYEVPEESQFSYSVWCFTNLLCKSVKCLERIA